ncbi:hypothetical protein [Phycicoccus endophyticus]|uniref:hypothetical protein n=1 Tax=Phycicoccus endophyticus TaxID=1690220 RepID=UPI0019B46824|nr:hypothetical protein [Phycicoccus endophyticus]GGL37063.1 hypothetical protein GCM10012283_19600 [Phycicoccus endophyticus]
MNRNRVWKLLGVAGAAGVVATGVLVARDERARRAYTPDEVRDRLRARLAEAEGPGEGLSPR